jgi:hypothetical protein
MDWAFYRYPEPVGMTMGVMGSFWVVFPEAGAFFENFQILGPVPLGVVQVMGRLKGDFLGEFDDGLFHGF